jgi:hypothetical protein
VKENKTHRGKSDATEIMVLDAKEENLQMLLHDLQTLRGM